MKSEERYKDDDQEMDYSGSRWSSFRESPVRKPYRGPYDPAREELHDVYSEADQEVTYF